MRANLKRWGVASLLTLGILLTGSAWGQESAPPNAPSWGQQHLPPNGNPGPFPPPSHYSYSHYPPHHYPPYHYPPYSPWGHRWYDYGRGHGGYGGGWGHGNSGGHGGYGNHR